MEFSSLIKEIGRGAKGARPMDADTACALFGAMLDDGVPDMELGAILLSMRIKGESDEELLGFKRALDARTPQLAPADGPRLVSIPAYNGARRQPNLMPWLALRLRALGVPVLIHGRFDFDTRTDPFALLAALDIHPMADLTQAQAQLDATGLACLRMGDYIPALDRLLSLRPRLGVRNSAHSMVKLLDPARGRSVRIVAVTHPEYLERMQRFLCADGGHALLLRGTEGEAYANPRRRPLLLGFEEGRERTLYPAAEGGAPPREDIPDRPDTQLNAALVGELLADPQRVPAPLLDQLACCLLLAGAAGDLADARRMAA